MVAQDSIYVTNPMPEIIIQDDPTTDALRAITGKLAAVIADLNRLIETLQDEEK